MRFFGIIICLVFYAYLSSYSSPLALIEADEKQLQDIELYTARTSLRRFERWLGELGVWYSKIPQRQLSIHSLKGIKIVILPYNPKLSHRQVDVLQHFTDRGGMLFVFQASSPFLAKIMSVRVGAKASSNRYGQWNQIDFLEKNDTIQPQKLFQHTWHMVPAYPSGSSRIFARWRNVDGEKCPEPAVLKTAHGYWFSQVLLDGNSKVRHRLLLSLLAECDPDLWKQSVMHLKNTAVRVSPFISYHTTMLTLNRLVKNSPQRAKIVPLLKHISVLYLKIESEIRQKNFKKAVTYLFLINRQLQRANALTQRPIPSHALVGVWDHNGTGLFPGDWPRTADILSKNGVNTLFANMLWVGKAHCRNVYVPPSKTFGRFGDQLKKCIQACRPKGIAVHVWKVCWKLGNAPPELIVKMRKEGRLQVNSKGKTIPWLCPSHPENQELEIKSILDIAKNYPVQGIHLDYIRFPDRDASYSGSARKAFENYLGKAVRDWPKAAWHKERLAQEFQAFRAHEITQFLRKLRIRLQQARPTLKLSAAVFGKYPACIDSVGQDYGTWLKDGLVDFITPMNYTQDSTQFTQWLDLQNTLPNALGKIFPGIGVSSNESELQADQVIHQINLLRRRGNAGFVLYKLDHTLANRILPLLSNGILTGYKN